MRAAGAVLMIIGVAFAGLGIYLGLASVARLGIDCGSGFGGVSSGVAAKDDRVTRQADVAALTNTLEGLPADRNAGTIRHRYANACQPAVSDRRTLALVVGVPGAALFVAGIVVSVMSGERRQSVLEGTRF